MSLFKRAKPSHALLALCMVATAPAATAILSSGNAGATTTGLISNGSFEDGNFTGWTIVNVAGGGCEPWEVLLTTSTYCYGGTTYFTFTFPTTISAVDGTHFADVTWDGFAGTHAELSQVVSIPTGTPATLSWYDNASWVLEFDATQNRIEYVDVLTSTGTTVLQSFPIQTLVAGTAGQTGWVHRTLDLSAYAGQTVEIRFRLTVPQRNTGPANFALDDVSLGQRRAVTTTAPPSSSPPTVRRIYGQTADATAADELSSAFVGTCPGAAGNRPVVLATDQGYPDALSSAYLAADLATGTLLTPTASLSSPTKAALQKEGITHVYVVGGPLAVSTAVVATLEHTPAYTCGGTSLTGADLQVTRIYGTTASTTAAKVAAFPGQGFVGVAALSAAYVGNGKDNTTTGASSSAPTSSSPLRTAIVASDKEFQDAEAGGTLSYGAHLPILLTTPGSLPSATKGAIGSLGIQQVILLGGPLAVSTAVVSGLETDGVSVLRVAGSDYTGTAVELAQLETASTSVHQGFGWDVGTAGLAVARGDGFQDGLAGAVVAAHGFHGSGPVPLLLTESPTTIGQDLMAFLRHVGAHGIGSPPSAVSYLVALGGPDALSASVVSNIAAQL